MNQIPTVTLLDISNLVSRFSSLHIATDKPKYLFLKVILASAIWKHLQAALRKIYLGMLNDLVA
jgi:hypothetical protein